MIRQAFGRDHPIQAPPPRPHRPKRRATPSRRAPFSMEQLEPRVLLSADISYLPSPGSNSYSLAAYDDAGSIAIRLTQTAGVSSGFSPWSESFTAAEPVITLSVGGGA
ncbi:MAG: LEPR-XLL domain-containing protein, partial [Hylemonella sp.]|nr:LEPR-XLL domain-containing protein [Hylemonella sp.]